MRRKLLIQAGTINAQDKVVPVNTGKFTEVSTDIGTFSVSVFIRNFDGSSRHNDNSLYNVLEKKLLDGTPNENTTETDSLDIPSLRLLIKYRPNQDISGSELFFGNESPVAIKDYVPTTLMSTGLRFFKWFLNPSIESDLYGDNPFIYGLALNSFSKFGDAQSSVSTLPKESNDTIDWGDTIPHLSLVAKRKKYFCTSENASKFRFRNGVEYTMIFDTDYLKLGDSCYSLSLPAFGSQSFDVNILRFANEKLDNINWIVKRASSGEPSDSSYGLVLNFRLMEEEDSKD